MLNKELTWNVYIYNSNKNIIEPYNIFNHYKFMQYLYKAKKEYLKKDNFRFEDFIEQVKKEVKYYYSSKSEYELIIQDWPCENIKEKISIYDQVILNWEAFKEYLYKNYKYIRRIK